MPSATAISATARAPRALVTGGSGFLGMAIARLLRKQGWRVCSLARRPHERLAEMGVDQVLGSVSDTRTVDQAVQKMDVVFHTAAKAGVWGAEQEYIEANEIGTRRVIQACRENGVPRLIHTSSASVVFNGNDIQGADESAPYAQNPGIPYLRTKIAAEKAVVNAAGGRLQTLVLRPHLIWGPGDNHLVPRILARARQLRRVGDGRNKIDTIYIDNAAAAHLMAADCLARDGRLSGRIYFISQDEPIRLWDLVDRILAAGGLPPVKGSVPRSAALAAGGAAEWIYRLFKIKGEPKMTRFVAHELSCHHWFDISAAKRDLGYKPRISTDEGLRRLAHWLKATVHS